MINRLTWAYIKKNKKRSVLTLIGIIIATSLITGVFTIFTSMQNALKTEIIKDSGYYHVKFLDINNVQMQIINNKFSPDVQYKGVTLQEFADLKSNDYSSNENSGYDEKLHSLQAYDDIAFHKLNIKLEEGRYPINSDEILISKKMHKKNNMQLGDKISYYQKDYTIVGFYLDSRYILYDDISYFISNIKNTSFDKFNYYMAFDDVTSNKIEEIEKFAKENSFQVEFNSRLLKVYNISGNSSNDDSIYMFFGILIGIIVIAAISLIYNVFAISVNERRKELAILACIGADKRQLKKIVYREIFILGGIGTFFGIVFGILGIYVTFEIVNNLITNIGISDISLNLEVFVNRYTILYSVIISAITLFVSGILPAKRAKGVSLIEGVKGQENIVISKRIKRKLKKKHSKFKILGGYIGVLAGKNMTRSKRRYIISIISLGISVIIFLASFSFLDISFRMYDKTYGNNSTAANYVIINSVVDNNKQQVLNYIDENDRDINNFLIFKRTLIKSNDMENTYIDVIGIEKSKNYDYSEEDIKNGVLLYDTKKFDLKSISGMKLDKTENIKFDIGKIVKKDIKEKIYADGSSNITVLIDMDTYNRYFGNEVNDYSILIGANDENSNKIGEQVHKLVEENNLRENNLILELKIFKTIRLIIYIFVYGFVSLVSLISIVNIINTVSSNINIRIKEISVLRSVGMSKRSMMLMLFMENIITIFKTILLSFPISLLIHILLINSISYSKIDFFINPLPICIVLGMLILFTLIPTIYSTGKLRKSDIIAGIR